jgi:predicted CopG family antitoxin
MMPRKTISLGYLAYQRLAAAKRPGETFSDVVIRLVDSGRASFRVFDGLLDEKEGVELDKTSKRMRSEDGESERSRLRG